MWNSFSDVQLRTSRTFIAALAVNQNDPENALKIMNGEDMYMASSHINLMAWAQMGQLNKILKMLKSNVAHFKEKNGQANFKISFEVVSVYGTYTQTQFNYNTKHFQIIRIEKLFETNGSPEDKDRFRNIHNEMIALELLATKVSFDNRNNAYNESYEKILLFQSFDDIISNPFKHKLRRSET